MRRTNGEYRVGIGSSSVLMILVVIALAALSLLSFSRAHENEALSDRTITMTLNYYQAAAQAQRMLAEMDDLATINQANGALDADGWNALLAENGLEAITFSDAEDFSFSLDAGAGRLLMVEGVMQPDSSPHYVLTRHEMMAGYVMEEPVLQLLNP